MCVALRMFMENENLVGKPRGFCIIGNSFEFPNYTKTLREDAQLAEMILVLKTPLAREEFASKLFVLIMEITEISQNGRVEFKFRLKFQDYTERELKTVHTGKET